MNNIYVNNDPLLSGGKFEQRLEQLRQMQDELERVRSMQAIGKQAKTPTWDEINRIMDGMTEQECEAVRTDEEFAQSEQRIMAILSREYMNMMRPIVEGTREGKEALENHLNLVKSIQKRIKQESARKFDEWREYTEKYANMTFKKYKEMKGAKK